MKKLSLEMNKNAEINQEYPEASRQSNSASTSGCFEFSGSGRSKDPAVIEIGIETPLHDEVASMSVCATCGLSECVHLRNDATAKSPEELMSIKSQSAGPAVANGKPGAIVPAEFIASKEVGVKP